MSNIISIIVLICSFGIILGYARPLYQGDTGSSNFSDKSVKELKMDVEKYSEAFDRIREIEEIKGGLQTKYNSISETDREKISKSLPNEIDVIRLIVDLNERTSNYGMSMKNISINKGSTVSSYSRPGEGAPPVSGVFPSVELSFEITGSYNDLLSFFGDLEKSLRLVEISSLSISSSSSSEKESGGSPQSNKTPAKNTPSNSYSAKISIKSYYLSDSVGSQNNNREIIGEPNMQSINE